MINQAPKDTANTLADQAANSADNAIKSTKNLANNMLDGLADGVQNARNQAAPLLNRAGEQASALVQRGVDTVRETSQQLQDSAQRASNTTVKYIKDEPVKSMLIAAATGAALMALVGLMGRNQGRS